MKVYSFLMFKLLKMLWIWLGLSEACMLSTSGVGVCSPSVNLSLAFCEGELTEAVCVPNEAAVWNWTVQDKDVEVRTAYILEIENILALEVQGIGGQFSSNINCAKTLKAIMCQINFPYCANDTSLPVCGKGCEYLNSVCLTNVDICTKITTFTVANYSICAAGEWARVAVAVWIAFIS
jgi:hypothetical protein